MHGIRKVLWQKNNDLVLASLQMAHVVMKRKRPYTELESVVLPCLEILLTLYTEGKSHRKSKANSFIRSTTNVFLKIC